MKVYSLLTMENGMINTWLTFKNKNDALDYAEKMFNADDFEELKYGNYVCDDNGYEAYFKESELN